MLHTTITSSRARATVQLPTALRSAFQHRSSPAIRILARRTFTQPTRPRPSSTNFTFTSYRPSPSPQTILQRLRTSTFRFISNSRARRNGKPPPNGKANGNGKTIPPAPEEPNTLSGRLKKLSREYGWSALGIYLALSALDFPFCYLLVRYLGADRIGAWEHIAVTHIKAVIPESVKEFWQELCTSYWPAKEEPALEGAGWGVEEAEQDNKTNASLATQLALAYAIHKSFIFIRVPLTAAVTPKVVKILRGWGWDIGKRTTKEAKALKRAANPAKSKRRKP